MGGRAQQIDDKHASGLYHVPHEWYLPEVVSECAGEKTASSSGFIVALYTRQGVWTSTRGAPGAHVKLGSVEWRPPRTWRAGHGQGDGGRRQVTGAYRPGAAAVLVNVSSRISNIFKCCRDSNKHKYQSSYCSHSLHP